MQGEIMKEGREKEAQEVLDARGTADAPATGKS